MKKIFSAGFVLIFAFGVFVGVARADSIGPITFDAPTYALGSINGQNGWSMTGPYDAAVASTSNFGSPAGFGAQALRISDGVTSGSFGDWVFAPPLTDAVGEADSTNRSFSPGSLQRHFDISFDIVSTQASEQPGLHVSVSPDRGDGSRMSYLRFADATSGIDVYFDDVQGTSTPANFVEAAIASGLSRTTAHRIELTLDTLDGPSNDVVKVWIDGVLVHTGTSWENYYRYDHEASAEQSPRIVKTIILQARGTADPANLGKGFLFGNFSYSSGPIPTPPPSTITVTIDKFIDGIQATAVLANSAAFPMNAAWNAANIGSGTGPYSLGPTGYNSPNPYEAVTAAMSMGASYTTSEVTGGPAVGADCSTGQPYAFVGYSTGATLAAAASGTVTTTVPSFTNLTADAFVVVHNKPCVPAPVLKYPANGTITTTAGLSSIGWNPVTDPIGGITYVYQSSHSSSTKPDGSFVSPAYTSGTLTATSIPTPSTPAGVYYWHVQAKDADGNKSPWSGFWMVTVDNTPPPALATCPAGTSPSLLETDSVNSASYAPTVSSSSLENGKTYLLVSAGTWQNGGINVADTAYASVDSWTTHMKGYNIPPYYLGSGEFQMQVDGSFVNWGAYQPTHQYAYLYAGAGHPLGLMVFDGDSTAATPVPNASWYGDNTGSLAVNLYACNADVPPVVTYVTTDPATGVTAGDAALNGTNVALAAAGHSFWVSTSTFSTASPTIPSGVYSTPDLGAIAASTTFSATLSSLTVNAVVHGQVPGTMPAITPNTTYYYAAWSFVNGTWYPGAIQAFTTGALRSDDTLSALGVSAGTLSPAFDPGTTAYTDALPYNTIAPPQVTATTTDPAATAVITQAAAVPGTATVKVTAQDGITTQDYTVAFSLMPATSSMLNVVVLVDNTAGGTATSSDFTVTVHATHPSKDTFPGDPAGTLVVIDPDTNFGVNVSHLPHYNQGTSGNCHDSSGIPAGNSATCTVTETYRASDDDGPHFSVGWGPSYGNNEGGGHVLGASIGGDDALREQIAALQARLLALLQQYVAFLGSRGGH